MDLPEALNKLDFLKYYDKHVNNITKAYTIETIIDMLKDFKTEDVATLGYFDIVKEHFKKYNRIDSNTIYYACKDNNVENLIWCLENGFKPTKYDIELTHKNNYLSCFNLLYIWFKVNDNKYNFKT